MPMGAGPTDPTRSREGWTLVKEHAAQPMFIEAEETERDEIGRLLLRDFRPPRIQRLVRDAAACDSLALQYLRERVCARPDCDRTRRDLLAAFGKAR